MRYSKHNNKNKRHFEQSEGFMVQWSRLSGSLPEHLRDNPYFDYEKNPMNVPSWDKLAPEHIMPACEHIFHLAYAEIDKLAASKAKPTFQNTIVKLEQIRDVLSLFENTLDISHVFPDPDRFKDFIQAFSKKQTQWRHDLRSHEGLKTRVLAVSESDEAKNLDDDQKHILSSYIAKFTLDSDALTRTQKAVLLQITKRITELSLLIQDQMGQNINEPARVSIQNKTDLAGLSRDDIKSARKAAQLSGQKGWILPVSENSYYTLMSALDAAPTRRKVWEAYQGYGIDNKEGLKDNILELLALQNEQARLMGYDNAAELSAGMQMTQDAKTAKIMIDEIEKQARKAANKEMKALAAYAKNVDDKQRLEPWDIDYYGEMMREEMLQYDEWELCEYLELERVIPKSMAHFEKLFDISFRPNDNHPVYHKDVRPFDVYDKKTGQKIAVLFMDMFARKGKEALPAWDQSLRAYTDFRGMRHGVVNALVTAIEKPEKGEPCLMGHNELVTYMHEFGHALHDILNRARFSSKGALEMATDFVEVPSQLMENWAYEPEFLKSVCSHYETGASIPDALIDKVQQNRTFLNGIATLNFIMQCKLDMAWHMADIDGIENFDSFESGVMDKYAKWRANSRLMSTDFAHSFGSGYDGIYYSYLMANVMEADMFALFKRKGIYDEALKGRLREVFAAGANETEAQIFKRFRGRKPDVKFYLQREGLSLKDQFNYEAAQNQVKPEVSQSKKISRYDAKIKPPAP